MNEKDKPIMDRNVTITTPFLIGNNRIINESTGQPTQRLIKE